MTENKINILIIGDGVGSPRLGTSNLVSFSCCIELYM